MGDAHTSWVLEYLSDESSSRRWNADHRWRQSSYVMVDWTLQTVIDKRRHQASVALEKLGFRFRAKNTVTGQIVMLP